MTLRTAATEKKRASKEVHDVAVILQLRKSYLLLAKRYLLRLSQLCLWRCTSIDPPDCLVRQVVAAMYHFSVSK